MTQEERDLIVSLFERLKPAAAQPRDREAESVIAAQVAANPAAPYLLAQMALVYEHALRGAQNRITELEQQVSDGKGAPVQSGSFLGGLLTGTAWARKEPGRAGSVPSAGQGPVTLPREPMVAGGSRWGSGSVPAAGPQYAPAGGPSFLQSAMTTAAGVAGGMVLGNMLVNMLSHNAGSPVAQAAAAHPPADTAAAPAASPWETAAKEPEPPTPPQDDQVHPDDHAQHDEPAHQDAYDTAQHDPVDSDPGDGGFGGGGDSDFA